MPEHLNDAEVIIRALPVPLWDEVNQKASSLTFRQLENSFSREAVLTFAEIVILFKSKLAGDDPSESGRRVQKVGLIVSGDIRTEVAADPGGRGVEIIADPTAEPPDPSHALVKAFKDAACVNPGEFSRGLANKLKEKLVIRDV